MKEFGAKQQEFKRRLILALEESEDKKVKVKETKKEIMDVEGTENSQDLREIEEEPRPENQEIQ